MGHNEKKSEGEDKETECIFKAIMVENFPNKERNKHPDPWNRLNLNGAIPRNIKIKFSKVKDKGIILIAAR